MIDRNVSDTENKIEAVVEAGTDAANNESADMQWFVVQAFSNYEKRVQLALQESIERHGMQDFFGEILVPTEEVVEMRSGQKRTSERKFFPGYVLVQMVMNDDTWHLVKSNPKSIWVHRW